MVRFDANLTLFYTDERARFTEYSKPYASVGTSVFTRRGSEFQFARWEALIGKKGGIIRGDVQNRDFEAFAQSKLNLFQVDTLDQVLKMLVAGRIDYALYAKNPFLIEARKLGLADQISPLPNPISSEKIHIGFSKKSAFARIIPLINSKIEEYKRDGTLQRFVEQAIKAAAE